MYTRFIKTALVCALSATFVAGCGTKTIKADPRKPAKLVNIESPISVLSPVFSTALGSSSGGKGVFKSFSKQKVAADLQVAKTGNTLIAVSPSGLVTAFNASQTIWSSDIKEIVDSGVATDGRVAVVGTRSGKVMAFDVRTGDVVWQSQLAASSQTPAVVAHGRVLISGNNGVLYGLDAKTGAVAWQFGTQNPEISVRGAAKPVLLDDGSALFGTADGRIHALDVATGNPLWTRRIGLATGGSAIQKLSDVDGEPVVVGTHLYVPSYSGQLAAFDMATGRLMFVAKAPSIKSVSVLGDLLIVSGVDGDVFAFHRLTGEEAWANNQLKHRKLTNPVAVGQYVAVGDFEGVVHVLDKSGRIVSRANTKGQLTSLQVIDGRVYAQSADGVVNVWQIQGVEPN